MAKSVTKKKPETVKDIREEKPKEATAQDLEKVFTLHLEVFDENHKRKKKTGKDGEYIRGKDGKYEYLTEEYVYDPNQLPLYAEERAKAAAFWKDAIFMNPPQSITNSKIAMRSDYSSGLIDNLFQKKVDDDLMPTWQNSNLDMRIRTKAQKKIAEDAVANFYLYHGLPTDESMYRTKNLIWSLKEAGFEAEEIGKILVIIMNNPKVWNNYIENLMNAETIQSLVEGSVNPAING
jgi:hypothetical protein